MIMTAQDDDDDDYYYCKASDRSVSGHLNRGFLHTFCAKSNFSIFYSNVTLDGMNQNGVI